MMLAVSLISFVVLIVSIFATSGVVSAHANLERSTPLKDAVLNTSPKEIRIQFTEEIDSTVSKITVEDQAGNVIKGSLSYEADRWLIYTIPELSEGVYKVKWQVLSVDTHVTDGSFRFSVAVPLEKEIASEAISLDDVSSSKQDAPKEQKSSNNMNNEPLGAGEKEKQQQQPAVNAKENSALELPNASSVPALDQSKSSSTINTLPSNANTSNATSSKTDAVEEKESVDHPKVIDTVEIDEAVTETKEQITTTETVEDNTLTTDELSADQSLENERTNEQSSAKKGFGDSLNSEESIEAASSSDAEAEEEKTSASKTWTNSIYQLIRMIDVLLAIGVAAFLYVRYVLIREEMQTFQALKSLAMERKFYAIAALILLLTGLVHLLLTAKQLAAGEWSAIMQVFTAIAGSTILGKIISLRLFITILLVGVTYIRKLPLKLSIWIKGLLAAGLLLCFPLTGHAFGAGSGALIAVSSHVVHMLAGAIWIGGLVLIWLITARKHQISLHTINGVVLRFSKAALLTIFAIIITGLVLTIIRIHSLDLIWGSEYGRLILYKAILLLLIVVIGICHQRYFIPMMTRSQQGEDTVDSSIIIAPSGFIKLIRLELCVAVVLILLAGMLSTTSPPM